MARQSRVEISIYIIICICCVSVCVFQGTCSFLCNTMVLPNFPITWSFQLLVLQCHVITELVLSNTGV